jgi:cysteine-S-conjugate beta-lyase
LKNNFDQVQNRLNTASLKWDQLKTLFGSEEVLPMWVADMDFQSPAAVIEALTERAQWGIYGYTITSENYYEAVAHWLERRHDWQIKKEWLCYCPGIVTALSILVELLTEPGEQVIIQPPVYAPFFHVVNKNHRKVREVPLVEQDGQYVMDFVQLEEAMKQSNLMILCSPHNPVGRVWTKEELIRLGELSIKHKVIIVSDEIHADLIYKGNKHYPFGSLSDEIAQQSITCVAPSKTFNLAGLKTSTIIIPNPVHRNLFKGRINTLSLELESYFGASAVVAAYNEGEEWLEALLDYLYDNLLYLADFLKDHLPEIKLTWPQGTYLAWLDFRELGFEADDLQKFLLQEAKVGLSAGTGYGTQGTGYMRMNLACPRPYLEEGLQRIKNALQKRNNS